MSCTGSLPSSSKVVDPRNYHRFCFRGEGQKNCAISATHRSTGNRIVWRFGKIAKTPIWSTKSDRHIIDGFVNKVIKRLLSEEILVDMKLIEFQMSDALVLGKIPKLELNIVVESFEELKNLQSGSVLPEIRGEEERLQAIQMADITQIPRILMDMGHGPVITVEIKPRQGFYTKEDIFPVPYCSHCVDMIGRVYQFPEKYPKMARYCAMDMYSGSYERMYRAVHALFMVPYSSLRITVDGDIALSDQEPLEEEQLNERFFKEKEATYEELISAICLALSGNSTLAGFQLQDKSVLGQLLKAQKINDVGVVKAYNLCKKLGLDSEKKVQDYTVLTEVEMDGLNEPKEEEAEDLRLLQKFMLGAVLRDVSLIISLRLVESPKTLSENVVRLPNGKSFGFFVKVVDVDPFTTKHVLISYDQYMDGYRVIQSREEVMDKEKEFNPCNIDGSN